MSDTVSFIRKPFSFNTRDSVSLDTLFIMSVVRDELFNKCKKFDTANTGFITTAELKSALAALGEEMGDSDVNEMIDEAQCWQDIKTKSNVAYEKFIEALYADAEDDQ